LTIEITATALRQIWPRAPQSIIDAFVSPDGQAALERAGITHTRPRLAFALTQVEHETGGWTIRNLTENINYTPERAAQIWPSRFRGGAAAVRAKYGTAPGWQIKMFDDVYGGRMGNRPGSHDGSTYIGRGGPQVTGRDGYREVAARCGVPILDAVELATRPQHQPAILAAFWAWKNLNAKADAGDFKGCTRLWNGGLIGEADREHLLKGNDPIVARLAAVDRVAPIVKDLPGAPPSKDPPPEVVAEATKAERAARAGGVVSAGAGGVGTAADTTSTSSGTQADGATVPAPAPFLSPVVTWTAIGLGVAIVVIATVAIARKRALVKANWF
jgi:putative chitinase